MAGTLTLQEALKSNRLDEFIAQAEAEGVAGADADEFLKAVSKAIKAPRSEDQTSRSSSRGGSTGKRTR